MRNTISVIIFILTASGLKSAILQLGPNVSVGLMCGTQALKDCIAEAQPLIDAAKAAASQTK